MDVDPRGADLSWETFHSGKGWERLSSAILLREPLYLLSVTPRCETGPVFLLRGANENIYLLYKTRQHSNNNTQHWLSNYQCFLDLAGVNKGWLYYISSSSQPPKQKGLSF